MEITFIHEDEDFLRIGVTWNRLVSRSVTNVPFLRHEFQYSWWKSLGGGEWGSGELWIATGLNRGGDLLGVAPFFRTISNKDPILMFIGSKEISDYLDLIITPDSLQDFIYCLFLELGRLPRSVWTKIDLYNLPEWSPTSEAICRIAAQQGWTVEQERLQPCPIVLFSGDWEAYLGQLKKKQRHELRRKIRRAEAHEQGVSFRLITSEEELQDGIIRLMELMAYDQKKAQFLTSKMRSHLSHMITQAFENGWLMLAFLEFGGEPIAAYLNFDYLNHLWIYNSGINPNYFELSPGWVLMGYIIQWAIENGQYGIDFLRGDEGYKYQLGAENRFVHRLVLSRKSKE